MPNIEPPYQSPQVLTYNVRLVLSRFRSLILGHPKTTIEFSLRLLTLYF